MNISDIHFHDTQILRVVEDTLADTLTMDVDYPADWGNNKFVRGALLFTGAHNYQVFEGPFDGAPTLLGADIIGTSGRWSRLRLQTNAGHREVSCLDVRLLLEEAGMRSEAGIINNN